MVTQESVSAGISGCDTALTRLLNQLPSGQAIVVIGKTGFRAEMGLYEQKSGGWSLIKKIPASVGAGGMGKTKEGDQKSPTGIFSLGIAFGLIAQPAGVRYPYVCLTPEDYWVDDSRSADYNRWVHYHDGDQKDWQSAERLCQETICYRHAVVINYNAVREPGKGSAIFLHVWKGEDQPTGGCTAVSEGNMALILQWLDPRQAPFIVQGTPEEIMEMAKGKRHS
ncbi:MAG TPA: hypothetical protein DDW50_01190 [Firmicutes bacterium]|jgi:L,D-peptidoglycan transpeptidase YkuD (ErfK/YbiS/YcfS/YnhG family)|nr:hypothetical protein [Bacillota bacterium]